MPRVTLGTVAWQDPLRFREVSLLGRTPPVQPVDDFTALVLGCPTFHGVLLTKNAGAEGIIERRLAGLQVSHLHPYVSWLSEPWAQCLSFSKACSALHNHRLALLIRYIKIGGSCRHSPLAIGLAVLYRNVKKVTGPRPDSTGHRSSLSWTWVFDSALLEVGKVCLAPSPTRSGSIDSNQDFPSREQNCQEEKSCLFQDLLQKKWSSRQFHRK